MTTMDFFFQDSAVGVPVVKHICYGLEAPGCHTTRTCVTAIHCPKHEVALVWIELQQQHHGLTTQLVNLDEINDELLERSPNLFNFSPELGFLFMAFAVYRYDLFGRAMWTV